MRLLLLAGCTFSSLLLIAQTDAAYDWIVGPNLTYTTYEENPDKNSDDKMINLWFSDANGTWFYPTIDEEPIRYDYVTSSYSRFLLDKEMILMESPKGLIFANREGKKLRFLVNTIL
ncbi:hypothetical protein [Lewinella cohaerens]|uniref:hypothetical protein n=1 Tax=Lewinella cohaerens TaxID=70995 RepID=UPI00036A7F7E|nr:hypothetical protein [Lewinella cohaerens]